MNDNPSSANRDRASDDAPAATQKLTKLVIFAAILATVAYVGGNGMKNAWTLQRQIECSRHMQKIAEALTTYDYDQATASQSPIEFLRQEGLEDRKLVCPRRGEQASNYVVAGLLRDGPGADSEIILYEPLTNHDGVGANVLYANGHAQFVKPKEYSELISKINPSEQRTSEQRP